ncbi:hybrid sensor histidine kinase/response regulator [Sphingomonas ginsenosidivorax]|uniref:histidine kinase n=2 Tax=Sphingomonas ginsenosidivorax TaxID=862135 RepID=A0A5C6UP74_9SPHN|nr:hybrid sensor histidine kinase/response regulator [Sphingomonas ginsenosidivorax]
MKVANGSATGDWRNQIIATAAQAALQRHQPQRAAALITQALTGVDPATTTLSFRDMHDTAYQTYMAVGDMDAALVHLRALKRLDDNATRLAIDASTALMGARFDFANQELKISQLKASELERGIAFERARAQTQRYAFLGASVAIAIVIGLLAFALFTARRSRDRVRAANADLAITNSALGKALAAKTEFLATTSHEIRTPLNGILGMTEVMLADAALAPAVRDRLNVVHGAGVTMRALVDDILDVAKMETGNLSIESAPFDLRATVIEASRMWEEQARAKGLGFDVDLTECPALIVGDAARVRQIVFNLLSNALKFTAAGRVALVVDVTQDDSLRIAVSDSGIGIAPEKLEEIFESFRQADAGTTRQFGGTGLGLAICRNLARAMGGDVSVGSVVGAGATFTLMLPLVRAEAAVVEDCEVAGDRVLVVDRNPITRMTFRSLLAPRGGEVVFAGSVEDAVARLAEGGIRRVLVDDATVRTCTDWHAGLRAIAAAGSGADVTLLWPVSADSERDELLATGVARVVTKPVSGAALVAAMFETSVSKNDAIPDLVSRAA